MALPPKTVQCDCGHIITADRPITWCTQCGNRIFYDPKDKKKHKVFTACIWLALASAFGLMTYFFVEMVMKPLG